MARPGTDSCAGDGRSVDVGARFGGDGCLAADSDDEKTQMRFPALFLLGSLMALAFGVLELGLWWSPPADRSPLDEYFDAMSFDAKRAAVMKMTDEEDVLLVASSEDLIASPVGTYAALRLADLWAGDSRAIDRAMDRLLSETDPGMMLALLTALNSENTLRALAGEADLIAADYSGDGILDLLLPGSWNLSFNYARGDGTGQFSPDDTITVGAYSATAAVGDLDLDGLIDLVIPHMNGGFIGVNVYLAISPGEFVLSEDLSVPGSFSMWSIDLADFNNDGYLDIVIPDEQIGGIRVWINDGSGNFGMSTAYPGGGILSANSTTADFDLDGNVDVAVAGNTLAQGATNIVIFKGDGIGGFTADSAIPSQDCYTLNTADIDLDGRPDLIAANGPVNTVTPYHNETDVGGGGGGGVDFKRGDCNIDGSNNVADAVSGLQILFMMGGTPLCIDACDFNDDGSFNIADPIGTLSYLFDGGPAPPPPNFNCGEDPSADSLTCMTFSVCP